MLRIISIAILIAFTSVMSASTTHASVEQMVPMSQTENHQQNPYLLPQTVVIIDAGHGGIDGGAVYRDILEKDINLAVAKKLYLALESKGIAAALNRVGDYALSEENRWHRTSSRHLKDLSQRKALTEQINHQIFVSIHCNISSGSKASGPVVLYKKTDASYLLASQILEPLNQIYKTSRIPESGRKFYLLNYIQSPSVIVEIGFLSSPIDREKLTKAVGQTELAFAIANGISKYLWLNQ